MSKVVTLAEAIAPIKDGDTIMIGNFGTKAYPGRIVRALLKQNNAKDLFFIANGANPYYSNSLEKLLATRSRGMIATFIRGSAAAEKLFHENRLELVPQGTFAERLRAGGSGIPAFYTPVGIGTVVAEGKEIKEIDGKEYLLEKAITADVALIDATKVDLQGNCYMRGSTKSFGALMPAAAKYTVVETKEILQVGEIDAELITVPGIMVDAIVYKG